MTHESANHAIPGAILILRTILAISHRHNPVVNLDVVSNFLGQVSTIALKAVISLMVTRFTYQVGTGLWSEGKV